MSNEPTEIMVAVHVNRPQDSSVRVSIDGDDRNGKWIGRKVISSLHETGQTTHGTDRNDRVVVLPVAHITIPEWLAKKEGFI